MDLLTTTDYILTSTHGAWGTPQPVTAVTGADPSTDLGPITNLACPSLGNCTAIGSYTSTTYFDPLSGTALTLPFYLDEVNGVWGEAQSLPGAGTLAPGEPTQNGLIVPAVEIDTLSCWANGDCVAGGAYEALASTNVFADRAFAASETNGVWGNPSPLAGVAKVSGTDESGVTSVSCSSATVCEAVGYLALTRLESSFVDEYRDSHWLPARRLDATRGLGLTATSISCSVPGCVALGTRILAVPADTDFFQDIANYADSVVGYVAHEIGGRWSVADTVPLTYKGEIYSTVPSAVACTKGGYCVEGGDFVYAQHVNKYKILVNSTEAYVQTTTL